MTEPRGLVSWARFMRESEIPVLKATARDLEQARTDEEISPRALNLIVMQDPMMVFRILRYMQAHRQQPQLQDLVLVEQALMMMGVSTFFREIPPSPLVEDSLSDNLSALLHLFKLIQRAHNAARYAYEWGVMLKDLHVMEVRTAALLHDLAEMLLWCFAPARMLTIIDLQHADRSLRSHDAQWQVFGFSFAQLQAMLIKSCDLPPLLARLNYAHARGEQQVRNVTLAVNLARHVANGWEDAALPDDYRDVAEFLRVDVARARHIIGVPSSLAE